jgi:hypothetical protein
MQLAGTASTHTDIGTSAVADDEPAGGSQELELAELTQLQPDALQVLLSFKSLHSSGLQLLPSHTQPKDFPHSACGLVLQ